MQKRALISTITLVFISILGFSQSTITTNAPTTGCAPLRATFTPPTGLSSYYWDAKNGTTSIEENPDILFTDAGEFDVELRETVDGPIIDTIRITVYAIPVLSLSEENTTGCPPFEATIVSTSELDPNMKVNGYQWLFSDLQSVTTTEGTVNYTHGLGSHQVSLKIITDFSSCDQTESFADHITVVPAPNTSFTSTPTNLVQCEGSLSASFSNTTTGETGVPLTYQWLNGKDDTTTTTNLNNQVYDEDGQYQVRLTASYPFGCATPAVKTVSIGNPQVEIIATDSAICFGSTASFTSSLSGRYSWSLDGTITSVSRTYTPNLPSGDHEIILNYTTSDNQCSSSDTVSIYVDDLDVEINVHPRYICEDSLVTFEAIPNQTDVTFYWAVQEFDTVNLTTTEFFEVGKEGTYSVNTAVAHFTRFYLENSLGCVFDTLVSSTREKPNAQFTLTGVSRGCAPLEVDFEDLSVNQGVVLNQWSWDFGDGESLINTTDEDVSHVYDTPGVYEAFVTVRNDSNCVDTSYTIKIEVGDDTSIDPTFKVEPEEFCWDEEVQFINTTSTDLEYDFRFFIDTPEYEDIGFEDCGSSDTALYNSGRLRGIQDVGIEIDYNGCFYSKTITQPITINGALAEIDYLSNCDSAYHYEFDGTNSVNYTSLEWTVKDSIITQDIFDIDFENSEDVAITLTADNGDGCTPHVDSDFVFPRQIESIIALSDTDVCINTDYIFDGSNSIDEDDSETNFSVYTWRFYTEDGSLIPRPYSTKEITPDFSFSESGEITATLVVEDINGCTDIDSAFFKVFDINADFTMSDNSICLPDGILFTDSTTADTTIVSWKLSYADGTQQTFAPSSFDNIFHDYTGSPTDTTVFTQLTITDILGCQESRSRTLSIYSPAASISISDQTLCNGDSVIISAIDSAVSGSNLNYSWNFGQGVAGTNSTSQTNTLVYTGEGSYTITLEIEEDNTGCPGDPQTKTINVQGYPNASFELEDGDMDSIYCNTQILSFIDASSIVTSPITSRQWMVNNQVISSRDNFTNLFEGGDYNIEYTVSTSFGCSDSDTSDFTVLSPQGNFITDITGPICQNEIFTVSATGLNNVDSYTWVFGDGNSVKDLSPVEHSYSFHPESGIFMPSLVLTKYFNREMELDSCSATMTQEVEMTNVVADFDINSAEGDTSQCHESGNVALQNSSLNASTYAWNFGDNTTSNSSGDQSINYDEPGTYDIQLTVTSNASACISSITKQITLYPSPSIVVVGDTVCTFDTLELYIENPNPTYTYSWTPSLLLSNPSGTETLSFVEETTVYTVSVIDTNSSCTNLGSTTAFVIQETEISGLDTTIVIGDSAKLSAFESDFRNFEWNPSSDLSCLQCDYPYSTTLESIIYTLTVIDNLGCFPPEDFIYDIKVRPETHVVLPTTFSPNEDGINDIVYVQGWGIKELVSFEIYNRWGELMYTSTDIEEGWNGRYKGDIQNSDAYAYRVVVKDWRDKELETEGYLNLIH